MQCDQLSHEIDCCDVQIKSHKVNFREHAQSKCGTFDFIYHIPGGGDKKVRAKM